MATYIIGDFIRETRIRKGYTQEEVSYGICTPASLSRIENGMQAPGRYILDKLMERLGMENRVCKQRGNGTLRARARNGQKYG